MVGSEKFEEAKKEVASEVMNIVNNVGENISEMNYWMIERITNAIFEGVVKYLESEEGE